MDESKKMYTDALSLNPVSKESIKELIRTVRGQQVLLDSDVARLYGYEVKASNQSAKRNKERFPERYRFQLTKEETELCVLKSQSVTLKTGQGQHIKKYPYVYTEQGVSMLAGILRSPIAVQVSLGIIDAFVEMRQLLNSSGDVYANIISLNNKLIRIDGKLQTHDEKFDELFDLLQPPDTAKQSIFYKGQFFDAYAFAVQLIQKAKTQLIIIDNYSDDSILEMLASKRQAVRVTLVTSNPIKIRSRALEKFEQQYGEIAIIACNDFHDRFIIIDNNEVYAFGASLKDMGKKCFEVSRHEDTDYFITYVHEAIDKVIE